MSIVTENLIALNIEASDAIDAIRKAGEVLESQGYIKKEYTEAMINNFMKNGPYFAIAPGFAMPHARPEDGVFKSGAALITLKTPVSFGNTNDPIKLLMPLATSDNKEHLEYMSKIAALLGRKNIVEDICSSSSSDEVLKIII